MPAKTTSSAIAAHFRDRAPNVVATYAALIQAAQALGPMTEEPKKTSIHLVRQSAFAGVATQRAALVLTLKSATDLTSSRVRRHERASAHRWHLEVRLTEPSEIDTELRRWLAAAYALAG